MPMDFEDESVAIPFGEAVKPLLSSSSLELIAAIDRVDDGIPDDADAAKAYYYAMRDRYNEIIASEVLDTEAAA